MIFTPVTAGLYSLMTLGRMGVAWISIVTRIIELIARIMAHERTQVPERPTDRRHTLDLSAVFDGSEKIPTTTKAQLTRTHSTPDLREGIPVSSRCVTAPPPASRPNGRTSTSALQSPAEELQKSPVISTINVATYAMNPKRLRKSSVHAQINVHQELPHRMHTRAIIAGAVAIHAPKRFERLLRNRNWEQLSEANFREVSTEHTRIPESDYAFEEFIQYILPPTAVLLDRTLGIYPESMFRECAAGLLQLGFGLYQLISSDAHFSVGRDGLASPYLLVLPYLGMACVNTFINIIDPPYTVVTVLDISHAARRELMNRTSVFSSPSSSPTGYFRPKYILSEPYFPLRLPDRGQSSSNAEKFPEPRVETSTNAGNRVSPPIVQSPGPVVPFQSVSPNAQEEATWTEFNEWLEFAYEKRIDVSPVDRLYRTPWISHSIIIGEFIYTSTVGLLIPLVMLAVVGGWTRFKTSNYGLSLTFNLLALFGLPFIQFVLYANHLFFRVRRELKGRKEGGTFYWGAGRSSTARSEKEKKKVDEKWRKIRERSMWWTTVAQSVGLYFPVRRTVIVAYAAFVVAVAVCEFIFVGINLTRTLSCQGSLI